jgi:DNA-binding response OmpR family regulator
VKHSILVVEDDPTLNQRIQSVLAPRFSVAGALTAADARARLEADHFDLMLLDLHLPDRGGLELFEEAERDGLVGRAVILTGHGDLSTAIQAVRLRSLDYLNKPVDPDELIQRVERALAEAAPVVAPLETILARARRFLRADKIDGALAQLEAARGRYPESPEIVNLQGVAAELRHDLSAAAELYRRADSLERRSYGPARRNAERLASRSWQRSAGGIDFGDQEDRRRRTD